jgi:hypothetical protein
VRIRYVDRGAGPPVVLVHGFTASIETSWIDTGVSRFRARLESSVRTSCGGIIVAKLLTTHAERFLTAVIVHPRGAVAPAGVPGGHPPAHCALTRPPPILGE